MRNKHRIGFSLVEILIVMAIVGGLMAIVSVTANTIYQHSRETAALAHVRTLQNAEAQFYSMKRRFAPTLKDLESARVIAENLAGGTIGGYVFDLAGTDESFTIKANPESTGRAKASFYTDDSLVIRQRNDGPADRDSPPLK